MRPYSWRYVDVVADDLTLVAIFMHAPVFSPRELLRAARQLPSAFAVNAAVYRKGRCVAWAFNEYSSATETGDGAVIGGSSWLQHGSRLAFKLREASPSASHPDVQFEIDLVQAAPSAPAVTLLPGTTHGWQAMVPRGSATVRYAGREWHGVGYSDRNFGDVPLGTDLRAWTWTREHDREQTRIIYTVNGAPSTYLVEARGDLTTMAEIQVPLGERRRTAWGLSLPRSVTDGKRALASGQVIESSPFYARLQTAERLTEVAHFARYRTRWCRWMPYYRSAVRT